MTGAEALLCSLTEEGVDTLFGYPGGTIMPLYDKLYDFSDRLNHILVRHEQGAVHAAEGYARATGKVGVCMATAGPGATNTVTGIADAFIDSTPLVCITAQVQSEMLGTNFFQEADTISITIPITKWSYQITSADEVAETVAKAFYIARSGRPGPVLISFTKNAQVEMTEYRYKKYRPTKKSGRETPQPVTEQLGEAVGLLNGARRPMIIFGQGITISGAEKELLRLAEQGNIPIASTLLGISSVPSGHPLLMGNVGMHGNLAPNRMTQESDVILAIGMRFSDRVTGTVSKYAPNAKIVHIDIDRAELNKIVKVHLPIRCDAKEALREMLPSIKPRQRREWFGFIEAQKAEENATVIDNMMGRDCGCISMAGAVDAVARAGKGNAVIVTDVGQHQMFSARYSKFNKPRSLITSGGLGTMGFGLPAAIGAKVGRPDREVIAIMGDGGFQMSIQELGTIMQSDIGIKMVVLNNSYLGMVRQWQQLFFSRRYSHTELVNPDFTAIAAAYGIPSARVTEYCELDAGIGRMMAHEGPYFLEIACEKEENVFPMVPAGASLNDILLEG